MPVEAECQSCGRALRLRDELAGRKIKCPNCSEVIDLSAASTPAVVPAKTTPPKRRPTSSGSKSGSRATDDRKSKPKTSGPGKAKSPKKQKPPNRKTVRKRKPKVDDHYDDDFADDFEDDWDDQWQDEARPAKSKARKPAKKKKSKRGSNPSFAIAASVIGLVVLLTCSGMVWWGASALKEFNRTILGEGDGPIEYAEVPIPSFPDLGAPRQIFPSGVEMFVVDLGTTNDANSAPGFGMKMQIYRPANAQPNQSLPCVLVAPAGTNLLVGNALDSADYHDETLPYAESGIVTIFYSLDGGIGDMETATDAKLARGYKKFLNARAGIINGRNALEFALAKLPEVDPSQFYTAGHSSAGTVSLLLAAHDKRIAGCIAYAPCSNVELFLAELLEQPSAGLLLPGVKNFTHRTNPLNHASRLTCPLFLFHAADDQVTPIANSRSFAQVVGTSDKEFMQVPNGGHYQPMVDQGIPAAIDRIKTWSQ